MVVIPHRDAKMPDITEMTGLSLRNDSGASRSYFIAGISDIPIECSVVCMNHPLITADGPHSACTLPEYASALYDRVGSLLYAYREASSERAANGELMDRLEWVNVIATVRSET